MKFFKDYVVLGVNPEPWEASQASVAKVNGKFVPRFYKPDNLRDYQEAIKDALPEQNDIEWVPDETEFSLTFFFWREVYEFEMSVGKRRRRANYADATNLTKGLEDALQGVIFKNDRAVRDVHGFIADQGPGVQPGVLIRVGAPRWADIAAATVQLESLRSTDPRLRSIEGSGESHSRTHLTLPPVDDIF